MTDWTQPNDIDYGESKDTVYEGFVKADSNFIDIYSKLSALTTLRAAATDSEPSSGIVENEIIFDSTLKKIKYFDGALWQLIDTAAAYTGGLGLDAGVKDLSRNVFLEVSGAAGSHVLNVYAATNDAVATLEINGTLYTIAADILIATSGQTGTKYVMAEPDTGTAFKLSLSATAVVAGKRKVGTVLFSAAGTVSWVKSDEAQDPYDIAYKDPSGAGGTTPPYFAGYLSANQNVGTTAAAGLLQLNQIDFDSEGDWDAGNFRYTPQVAGRYLVTACATANKNGTGTNNSDILMELRKNGSTYQIQRTRAETVDYHYGLATSCIVEFNGSSDYIDLCVYSPYNADAEGGARRTGFTALWIGETP